MIIWVKCMYVYRVWMNVKEFWRVQALYVATNALYWKFFKRQNSMHQNLPIRHYFDTSCLDILKTGKRRSVGLIFEI